MKRIISALLVLIMVFSLSACSLLNKTGGKTELTPSNGGTGKEEKDEGIEDLWKELSGIWVYKDTDGQGHFISFTKDENGALQYASGIMFSGAFRAGAPVALSEVKTNVVALTVDYPKIEASEMDSGADALTKSYTLELSYLDDGLIIIDDLFVDGARDYSFAGTTLEEANANFFSEEDGREYTLDGLWSLLYGVWVSSDGDGGRTFIWFLEEDGKRMYTSGVMFSGAAASGEIIEVTEISKAVVSMTVSYAAVPASEMDDGREAFVQTYTMDLTKADVGRFTIDDIFVPEAREFAYCAPTLEAANELVLS